MSEKQSYMLWKEEKEGTTANSHERTRNANLVNHHHLESLNKKEPFKYKKQLAGYRTNIR